MRGSAIAVKVDVRAAVKQCPDDGFAHHAVGDAKPVRDGRGIKPLDLIHDEGLPALWRHVPNQDSTVTQCVLAGKLPFRRASICQFGEELAAGDFVELLMPSASVNGDVGRSTMLDRDSPLSGMGQPPAEGGRRHIHCNHHEEFLWIRLSLA